MTVQSPPAGWLRVVLARCLEKKRAYAILEVDYAAALLAEHDFLTANVARLRALLVGAFPSVVAYAEMMDAMDRHSPLPDGDMPSVTMEANRLHRLCDEIRAALLKETT